MPSQYTRTASFEWGRDLTIAAREGRRARICSAGVPRGGAEIFSLSISHGRRTIYLTRFRARFSRLDRAPAQTVVQLFQTVIENCLLHGSDPERTTDSIGSFGLRS